MEEASEFLERAQHWILMSLPVEKAVSESRKLVSGIILDPDMEISVVTERSEDTQLRKYYSELKQLTVDILLLKELDFKHRIILEDLLHMLKFNVDKNLFQKEIFFPEIGSILFQINAIYYSSRGDYITSRTKWGENKDLYRAFFAKLSKISIIFNNSFMWTHFMRLADDMAEIDDFISRNLGKLDNNFDFCWLVSEYWTESQKREIIRGYFSSVNYNLWEWWLERDFPYFFDMVNSIEDRFLEYAKAHDIPVKQWFNSSILNHAMELQTQKYDLMIWILWSGSNIPVMNEMFWWDSAYIEWHRTWKKKEPAIRKIWKLWWDIDFSRYKRILVCEHDVDSWMTLEKIRDFLISKWVKWADVAFIKDNNYDNNRKVASRMEFYDNISNSHESDKTMLCDTIFKLYDLLESMKTNA